MNDALCLHHIAHPVTSLGPGRRIGVWVAGCHRTCSGCITPQLQPQAAGQEVPVTRLAEHLLGLDPNLDGVTLSGGEPFLQAEALGALLALLQAPRPHWSVLVFTGYTLKALNRLAGAKALLDRTDLLVDGPYRHDQPSDHPLAASANQRLIPLTPRGKALSARCEREPRVEANLGVDRQANAWLIGILTPEQRKNAHRALGSVSVGASEETCP